MSARHLSGASWPTALAGLACLTGLWLVGAGLAVPLQAHVAQQRLDARFDQALALAPRVGSGPASRVRSRAAPRAADSAANSAVGNAAHNGIAARLVVPRLGVREIVLAGNGTHEQLAEGPVMLRGDDAVSRVTVLAAHRDTHFLFVRDLRAGDVVRLQLTSGQIRRYRVVRFQTVLWNRFAIPLDPARPLLALTTCYPFGGTEYGGPWRRVAWAEQVG